MSSLKKETPDPGVFLVKGDRVSISNLSISVDEEGGFRSLPVELHTGIDMSPYWLNIAYQHVKATEKAHNGLMFAKSEKDDNLIGKYLKKESSEGMQAVVASGVAIDAYYSSIKEYVNIPKSTLDAWQVNGTARFKQIAEVLRVGFHLSGKSSKNLRVILKQNLGLRDKAVHPCTGTTYPLRHVELNKVTDWRYATFRFYNAKTIYMLTLSIIFKTASQLSSKTSKELVDHCNNLVIKLKPILRKYERKYGKFLPN